MDLQHFCLTLTAFSVSLSFTQPVGLLGQGISLSQGRYLHTQGSTKTYTPQAGFEPTISVFVRVKTVHALVRAANHPLGS
jgi:hypothetical protein